MPKSKLKKDAAQKASSVIGLPTDYRNVKQRTSAHDPANCHQTIQQSITGLTFTEDPSQLSEADVILEDLKNIDWAFTDDNTRYLTHDIHPYPAKFIPQIPFALIAKLSLPGDIVLDPFGGSGTTATESVHLKRRAISIDANPMAELIGRVKTASILENDEGQLAHLTSAVAGYQSQLASKPESYIDIINKLEADWVPPIPNLSKWFQDNVVAELALLRFLISEITTGIANDIATLSLSRIVIRVSNQDSETRYTARDKDIGTGDTLKRYLDALNAVCKRVREATPTMQYADVEFRTADSRSNDDRYPQPNSVGLIVTSPPYPNVTDYHLYQRFRLFWLGHDPRDLGDVEIGSHLRHQRQKTSFSQYCEEMKSSLSWMFQVLQPGRYAALVVGDAVYKGEHFSTSEALSHAANEIGFSSVGVIDRDVHATKRSFAKPGRRAKREQILILRKPDKRMLVKLSPPPYKMWPYEATLRRKEITAILGKNLKDISKVNCDISVYLDHEGLWHARRLAFTHGLTIGKLHERTWQSVLENGDTKSGKRKEPKYVTHGIHGYKGKFYPQLAKSLINLQGMELGSRIFDPFCGSGTSVLEGFLNGYQSFGIDMNPLAAKIARAKVQILDVDQRIAEDAISALIDSIQTAPARFSNSRNEFPEGIVEELENWFPRPVLGKLNWLLHQIRLFGKQEIIEYFEVILSSVIRSVSQQDPNDLRIRRRRDPLKDAPVIQLFQKALLTQYAFLKRYWRVASYKPGWSYPATVCAADSRLQTSLKKVGIASESIDLVITSPPYATALPYIDTDRLSLMAVMGFDRSARSFLEKNLTGSREIDTAERRQLESLLNDSDDFFLPEEIRASLKWLYNTNSADNVGFRRANMPALLLRYFLDMQEALKNVHTALKPGASAIFVIGNSRTKVSEKWWEIPTGPYLAEIAKNLGFEVKDLLQISVTTENLHHIKNAITENEILEFQKR